MAVTDSQGNVIYRRTEVTTPVENVIVGDLLHNMPVRHSEPQSDFIWKVQAWDDNEENGIELLMTMGNPIEVTRMVPLEDNQCIECGKVPVKYAAKRLCSRCYQRQHRATAREQSSNRTDGEVELPYPA